MQIKRVGFVLLVLMVLLLPLMPALSDNVQNDEKKQTEEAAVLELSLEDAIDLVFENSSEMAIAEIEHAKARDELKKAKRAARDIQDARDTDFSGLPPAIADAMRAEMRSLYSYDTYLAEKVYPLAMGMAETLAEKALEFRGNVLRFQAENAYYDVLKAQRQVENASDALARAQEQLRLVKVGLEAGVNAQVDVLGAEILVTSAGVELNHAKNELKTSKMQFNRLAGLDLEHQVKLISEFAYQPVEFDLEEIMQRAKEKDLTYIQLNENLKVQQETLDLAGSYYGSNVNVYKDAKRDYDIADLRLANADQDLELKIKNSHFMALTAEEAYQLMEKIVEQAEENYRLTKLRYEVGMATLLDLEKAGDNLNASRADSLAALFNYNSAVTMLQHGLFDLGGSGYAGSQ